MNRFNKDLDLKDDFENIKPGTYDALIENAVLDDIKIFNNGVDTGETTEGIKITFRIIDSQYKNRKLFKSLKFNTDSEFKKSAKQLYHLGIWDKVKQGESERNCIEIAANLIYKMVEKSVIVLYVGIFNDNNYCKIQKIRDEEVAVKNFAPQKTNLEKPVPVFDKDEELPF